MRLLQDGIVLYCLKTLKKAFSRLQISILFHLIRLISHKISKSIHSTLLIEIRKNTLNRDIRLHKQNVTRFYRIHVTIVRQDF